MDASLALRVTPITHGPPRESHYQEATLIERKGQDAYPFRAHEWSESIELQTYFLDQTELPVVMQVWEVPVGGGEGVHRHPRSGENLEEIYLVTKGTARFTLNGSDHVLTPGDAVLTRPEDDHGVQNAGDEPLGMVVVWGRAVGTDGGYGHLNSVKEAHAWRRRQVNGSGETVATSSIES